MPTTYKRGFSTAKRSGVPTKRVTDPMNPMVSYWVDAYGKRTKAPSGSSGSVSSGSLGVGSGSALTRTSVASPNRSMSSRVQGVKSGLREGAQVMSPVDIDVLTGKRSPTGMDAAILAASMVPVPGLKGIAKAGKAGVKAAGKTGRAVAKDAAKSASRRTAAESATIRKGNAAAKTPEMARKLEQQSATASASKSVNTAPRSSVVPRTGTSAGTLSRGITQKRLAEFSADKGKRIAGTAKSKRTAKERAQAQADLEDTLKRGAQARAEGRKPGEDIPAATGRGIYDPVPAPRSTPRQADRELISKALTKPRNPGKNASAAKQEKYQKDLAAWEKRQADMKAKTKDIDEGRRKPTGELKGASAKSARRQEEKRAKSKVAAEKPPAPKTPSTTKPKAGDPKPGAERKLDEIGEKELFYQEHSMSGYSKSAIDKMWKARQTAPAKPKGPFALGPSRKGPFAMSSPRAIEGPRATREPIDIQARPVAKPGKSTPIGAKPTRKGPFASGSPRAIEAKKPAKPRGNVGKYGPNKPFAQGMGPEGGKQVAKKLGRSVTTTAAVGAAAGGAMALSKSGAGKDKPDAKTGTGASGKAANAKAFEDSDRKQNANTRTREGIVDNKGRLISRKEFNQRSAFRARFGLDDMTEAQRDEWKKKNPDKWKAEVQRREEYRSTAGKKRFGKKALRITDKAKTRRSA